MPPSRKAGSPGADRDLLIRAVRDAAPLAMSQFRAGRPTRAESWAKEVDQSLVTAADLAVNARLREDLLGARPDYGWLSEEEADNAARLTRRRVFVVDPIDGTRSFAEGRPEFCLCAAVVEDGRSVAAAVFAPALDQLYDAVAGGPARLNGEPIEVSGRETLDGAEILSSKASLRGTRWGKKPPFRLRYVQPLAYRLCLVAAGRRDGVLTLRETHEWDIAAAALIAARAGARVSDATGAAPVFNKPSPRVSAVIAAAPALHALLSAGLL